MMVARRLTACILAAGLLCGGVSLALPAGPVAADTKDDLIRKREENRKEREKLESQLEGVDGDLSAVYLKLEDTRTQLSIANDQLAQAEADLAAAQRTQENTAARLTSAEAEQERITEEIDETSERIDGTRGALAEVVRTSYRTGGASLGSITELYEIGVGNNSVQELAARQAAVRTQTRVIDQLSELNSDNANAQARQDAVTERITDLKKQADEAVVAADAARAEKQQRSQEISDLEASQTTLAADLESRKDQIIADKASAEAADSDLQAEIAKIVAEERRKQRARPPAPGRPPAPAPAPAPGNPAPSGALIPPVPQPLYVTSPYGMRIYPITGGRFMHRGVDLRSACGNPQVASAAGTVSATKPAAGNGTHGNQVIINHGTINGSSYVTVYNHLSRFAVTPGQTVSQGQTIGYTGATGKVTGCHVHFEVWKNGSTIDPMSLPGF